MGATFQTHVNKTWISKKCDWEGFVIALCVVTAIVAQDIGSDDNADRMAATITPQHLLIIIVIIIITTTIIAIIIINIIAVIIISSKQAKT